MSGVKRLCTPVPQAVDPSLAHLLAELAHIDVLISREVRRWQLAGQDPADSFRGLYVSDAQADALLARPFATNWGHAVSLPPDEAQAFSAAEAQAAELARTLAEAAHSQGQTPRLERLAAAFGLDRFEVASLLICLAPALDLRYERLYGYLQDDVTRKAPSANLILDLLCGPGPGRLPFLAHFNDDAPLFRHRLIEKAPDSRAARTPLLSQALHPNETVAAWLLGSYQPSTELAAQMSLSHPEESQGDYLLAAGVWPALEAATGDRPIAILSGPDQAGHFAAARLLAAHLGRPLLAIDLAGLIAADQPPLGILRLALRDASLTAALPFFTGWDSLLAGGNVPPALLAEVLVFPELVIISGQARWQPGGVQRERRLLCLDFPLPGYPQRRALWQHYLGQATIPEEEIAALAGRFRLASAQIRDAVSTAQDMAAAQGSPLQSRDLFAAARAHSNPGLAALAHKIEPRYGWQDIVLPADQLALLREIIATVRGRPRVLDEWGVGQKLASSAGVTMLFAGPPGTGKTMAAEIIAGELGLDLYKIDLSTVVSKYIGETEKNLERIFHEAASSNAILFFDEADALFGKRSEVRDSHDRYANIEISYLLQRMEAYEGVTILATNLRANLDEAFTRRLHFVVDLPFPDEADRLRIWQALFPPGVPRAELDLPLLARRFKLAGGNIRNIIVIAAYLAAADGQAVTMEHLLHSTRRELQKMGRLVGEEDLAIHRAAGENARPEQKQAAK